MHVYKDQSTSGGKNPVVISETLQTSATNTQSTAVDASVQGNMAGHGVSMGKSNSFSRRFTEHGYVIGIISVLPTTAYQNGIERFWLYNDKLDFPFPEFGHLGEQEIKEGEIYMNWMGASGDNAKTWGYQSRYAECKYKPSRVAGDFRGNLNYWHMGRIFDSVPPLNENFIKSDPTERIFAIDDDGLTDKIYAQIYNNVSAVRPLPYYGEPRL